jgi:cytochrome c553
MRDMPHPLVSVVVLVMLLIVARVSEANPGHVDRRVRSRVPPHRGTPRASARGPRQERGHPGYRCVLVAALLIAAAFPAIADTIEEKAAACDACHGENGIPPDRNFPVIWGQHQGYLYLQLRDFKRGTRKNDAMTPFVEGLERDDMMALAEYFSKKPWPDLQQPPAPGDVAARARQANTSIGCTGCHLAQYQGDGTQPRLAGQTREYLLKSMVEFRTRERGNNPGMSDLMLATPEADLAPIADYLAGLQIVQ